MTTANAPLGELTNADWVRQAFRLPQMETLGAATRTINRNKQYSEGSLSFADTTPGGNASLNPLPQFTRTADPNVDQIIPSAYGMGRRYHEAIDANAQRIYLQFGIPVHNSLTSFFRTFYDPHQGQLANSGVVNSLLYSVGKLTGYVVFAPIVAVLGASEVIHKAFRSATRAPRNRYYYIKSAMPLYLTAVTTIANMIAVNKGLAQGGDPSDAVRKDGELLLGKSNKFTQREQAVMRSILPDIYRSEGGIDVRALTTRYQRLADLQHRTLAAIYDEAAKNNYTDEQMEARIIEAVATLRSSGMGRKYAMSTQEYLDSYENSSVGKGIGLEQDSLYAASGRKTEIDGSKMAEQSKVDDNTERSIRNRTQSGVETAMIDDPLAKHLDGFWDHVGAEMRDGSAFVSFVVDRQATVTETFSNSAQQSTIAAQMNEKSSEARSTIFNLGGGNLGDGVISSAIEGVIGGVKSLVSGTLDAVGLAGLGAVGGSAFVDIPDFWENSSTQFSSTSYTIKLRSPYAHPLAVYQNIDIPLSFILAAVLPRSTGKNSYTSPFHCKLWSQGRAKVEAGLIDSVTVTRGTGNLGWNGSEHAVGVDVTINVLNLSTMLHMPISNEISTGDLLGLTMFDEDNNFTDYMGVLAGLDLASQHYIGAKWRLRRAQAAQRVDSYFSKTNFASKVVNNFPGSIIAVLARRGAL